MVPVFFVSVQRVLAGDRERRRKSLASPEPAKPDADPPRPAKRIQTLFAVKTAVIMLVLRRKRHTIAAWSAVNGRIYLSASPMAQLPLGSGGDRQPTRRGPAQTGTADRPHAGAWFPLQEQAVLKTLTEDVLKSSEIEGEILDREQVRSSIARRLGIDAGALRPADRNVEGIVEMMLDATQRFDQPLSAERLFGWHGALFPTGRSGLRQNQGRAVARRRIGTDAASFPARMVARGSTTKRRPPIGSTTKCGTS